MNIFKYAAQACRFASRSMPASRGAALRYTPLLTKAFDKALLTVASVLCVRSHGVMVCGPSTASVAYLADERLFTRPTSI